VRQVGDRTLKISSTSPLDGNSHRVPQPEVFHGQLGPLPAGFEIRFGSLNFQATGNDYLMRITNQDELRARQATGPAPIHAAPAADAPVPAQADAAGPSAPRRRRRPVSALGRRGRNDDAPCATPRSTMRPPAIRQPLRQGNARFPDRGSPSACTVPRRHMSPPPTPMRQRAGLDLAAIPRRSGTPAPPPMTSHPTALPASCHPPPRTGTRSGTSPAYWTQ
jgi:hypothetical protein